MFHKYQNLCIMFVFALGVLFASRVDAAIVSKIHPSRPMLIIKLAEDEDVFAKVGKSLKVRFPGEETPRKASIIKVTGKKLTVRLEELPEDLKQGTEVTLEELIESSTPPAVDQPKVPLSGKVYKVHPTKPLLMLTIESKSHSVPSVGDIVKIQVVFKLGC